MLRTLPLLSAGLAILLLPLTVSAEDKKDGPPHWGPEAMFDRLDKNDDGAVSKDEVPEKAPDRFKEMLKKSDADGDGKVTKEEFTASVKERMEAMKKRFEQMRKGKDGPHRRKPGDARGRRPGPPRVPPMPKPEEVFEKFDKDGDGQLSKEEFVAGAKKVQERIRHMLHHRHSPHHAPRAHRGAPHRGHPARCKPSKGKEMAKKIIARLKEADKNDDGKISKDEAPDRLKKHFDKVDKNDDGFVDKAEVRRMLRHLAHKHAHRHRGSGKSHCGPDKDKKDKKDKEEAKEKD